MNNAKSVKKKVGRKKMKEEKKEGGEEKGYVEFSKKTFRKIKMELESSSELMDVKLCKFYFDVIKNILSKCKNKQMKKRKFLRDFLFKLRSETNAWCMFRNHSAQDSSMLYRLACLFRNSTCLSSSVAHYFGEILMKNTAILETLFNQEEIKICALGGGSAAEVVAIVRILQIIGDACELHPDIYVTIVDIDAQWEMTCFDVLKEMTYFQDFPERIQFFGVDSLDHLDIKIKEVIEKSDVITMVRILSSVEKKLGWLKLERIIQDICNFIQADSLFFVLDHPEAAVINACGGSFGKLPNFHLVRETMCGLHVLKESAVQLHFLLHNEKFGGILCNTYMNVFMRMWIKLVQPAPFINYRSCCQNLLEAAKRLEAKKDYFLETKAEYSAAKASAKTSFEKWKAAYTEKMLKAGRTQEDINTGVSIWKENCKKVNNVSESKNMMEAAFREFMAEVDVICDFKYEHCTEQELLMITCKWKRKERCVAKRHNHLESVLNALISLNEHQIGPEQILGQ